MITGDTDRVPARWLRPAATVTAIFVCPVLLILGGVIPFAWRFQVLVLMTLVAAGLALTRHSAERLGLTLPGLQSFVRWSVLPSVVVIAAILVWDFPHRHVTPAHLAFYAFFVLFSAPAQEFLYRGFLFAELRDARIPPVAVVLLSAVLFGFMHVIYRDPRTVALTLGIGLAWAVVFHSTRKVCIVAVSHAALGVAAILSGMV